MAIFYFLVSIQCNIVTAQSNSQQADDIPNYDALGKHMIYYPDALMIS